MPEGSTWTTVAAAYAVNGAADDALVAAATSAGVGLVHVGPDGSVTWSDEAYRLHGRPRWRRVRGLDDLQWGLPPESYGLLRAASMRLCTDPDVELRYVATPETGPPRELVLRALDRGVAVVHRAGASADPSHGPHDLVVDVRDGAAEAGAESAVESAAQPEQPAPATVVEPAAEAETEPAAEAEPASRDADRNIATTVLSTSPDLLVICELTSHLIVAMASTNPHTQNLVTGLEVGVSLADLDVHPHDLEGLLSWRDELPGLGSDEVRHTEVRFQVADSWRWRELRATEFLRSDDGELLEVVIVIRDVHDRVEANLRLAERERAFREVFDVSPVGLAVLDDQGRFSAVNDAFCRLVGRTREEVLSTVYEALLHPEDRAAAVISRVRRVHEGGVATANERRLVRSDGTVIWARMRTSEIDYDDEPRTLVSIEDVTSAKATEDRLRYDAMHDQLTGLPNRRLIEDRLDRALNRSRRTDTRLAIYFIDLDDLKRVNDTHPWKHRAGDVLITNIAVAIRDSLRDTDTLGRLGGDEFVAICEDVGDDVTITDLGDRILEAVRRPLTIGNETVTVGASIGVAVPDGASETADELLDRADNAMYVAKTSGGARMVRADATGSAALGTSDLLGALARDELRVNYQPVVSLKSGAVLGVEAVVRWRHPERGLVPAAEVRAALDSGSGVLPVVHWTLARTVDDVRTVSPARVEHLSVWLSLPARAALATSTRAAMITALASHDSPRDVASAPTIVLGLHEREVAGFTRRHSLERHLSELLEVGPIALGVTHFTPDTVPVGMLQRLATVSVTLDPALLERAATDPAAEELVRSLVASAEALGIITVAGGIGSHAELALARRLGVDAVQGDLIAPLAPLETYSDLLRSGRLDLPPAQQSLTAPRVRTSVALPAVAEPTVAEPTVAEPVVAEPVVAEPAPVIEPEPVVAEPEPTADAPSGAPRLLLGDIGEALARELGLDLPAAPAPLPEPPATAVSAPAVEPRGTAWGADPNDEQPPRRGAFADYELPPSPFLVLRPHDQ